MAESSTPEKQNNLEDSLSPDEWTIIYKKESKSNDNEKIKTEDKSDEPKETSVKEDSCESKEDVKTETTHIEEGEEAGEKEVESDDVSILSDESEPEHLTIEDGKIERIEWQVERKESSSETNALIPKFSTDDNNIFLICSIIFLICGITIASLFKVMDYRKDEASFSVNTQIEEKLRELRGIEDKLKELNDVKQALDEIKVLPEMLKLKGQLAYQKHEKSDSNSENYEANLKETLEKLYIENFLNFDTYGNRLELLQDTYQNFCSKINKINSSGPVTETEICKAPKILFEMIMFKKIIRRAFEQTQGIVSPDKRFFVDVERKLDSVSDSLLSELSFAVSKFSIKIQRRLDKFSHFVGKRLCLLYNTGNTNDKFVNMLLENDHFVNNCNKTGSSQIVDFKINSMQEEEKEKEMRKRSYEELKKNGFKYDYKNKKDKKNHENLKEDSSEKKSSEEISIKSKGEIKNDNNWKKNKYVNKDENKDKYHKEEKQYTKHEKFNNNYKKGPKNNKLEHEHCDDSAEDDESEEHYEDEFETNKKYHNSNHQFEYKKDKFENKKNYEFENQYKNNKNDHEFDNEHKYNKKENFNNYNVKINNREIFIDKNDEKYRNYKENSPTRENFKKSKYAKYQREDHRDAKDKYQTTGEWQMQRFASESEDSRERGRGGGGDGEFPITP